MITALTTPMLAVAHLASVLLGAPSLSIPVAIVGFSIAIGLAITLSPSRRTYEVKRPKDE
jgi:hypothetical protein